jgi:hypothetical protein
MSMPPVSRIRPRPRPGNLREVAERIEEATGLRVQVLGGKLVMPPTPRGKHAKVICLLEEMIRPKLPPDLVAVEMHTAPDNGAYRDTLPGRFGEPVPLPDPLAFEVETDGFPMYGDVRRAPGEKKGPFTGKTQ